MYGNACWLTLRAVTSNAEYRRNNARDHTIPNPDYSRTSNRKEVSAIYIYGMRSPAIVG